jgi:TatD DNase family protein
MIQRAIEKGVSILYSCNRLLRTAAMYDLEKNYPEHVFLMMGPHPTYGELFRRIAA